MYAIVVTGSKQYKVEKGDIIRVEMLDAKKGDEVKLDKVLLAKEGNSVRVGDPYVKEACVVCEALGSEKQPKVIMYMYKRRKSEKKKIGHRQELIKLKVKSIEIGG